MGEEMKAEEMSVDTRLAIDLTRLIHNRVACDDEEVANTLVRYDYEACKRWREIIDRFCDGLSKRYDACSLQVWTKYFDIDGNEVEEGEGEMWRFYRYVEGERSVFCSWCSSDNGLSWQSYGPYGLAKLAYGEGPFPEKPIEDARKHLWPIQVKPKKAGGEGK